MHITKHFNVYFKDHCIGNFYMFSNNKKSYYTSSYSFIGLENEKIDPEFKEEVQEVDSVPFIEEIISDKYRLKDIKKDIYQKGDFRIERIPEEVAKFWIYKRSANKGEEGYSDKD